MRNVFDQYGAPENRLTHALLCSIDADRALLRRFIMWVSGEKNSGLKVAVQEQGLPGICAPIEGDHVEARGLPDGCISDGQGWAMLVESKFMAAVDVNQLRRHLRTAERHGLVNLRLLVLLIRPTSVPMPDRVIVRTWRDVYCWLDGVENRTSEWARRLRQYLEVAEARHAADGYLREGALTMFSGIPFGNGEDHYTYLQAKRLIRLLREELLSDQRLIYEIGMDPESPGRNAITGTNESVVWDFISLCHGRGESFTSHPHLTLGITSDRLEAFVTFPNGLNRALRKRLLCDSFDEFARSIATVTTRLATIARSVPGSVPMICMVQRRYRSQRSTPELDCLLRFDPRTALSKDRRGADESIKHQPQWLRAAYDALRERSSNLQFQIGQDFPYAGTPAVASRDIVSAVRDAWLATRPLIQSLYATGVDQANRVQRKRPLRSP